MVERGSVNALDFIGDRMINSSIIIRSLVTFRNPLGLGISYERLEKSGITKLGVKICGNGTVYY